jgi:CDP-glucose 4,6-dehydratase
VREEFWSGKRVFITGHTGFKGAWLSLWLKRCGAVIKGYALAPPSQPSLFEEAEVADGMESQIGDVRDYETLLASIQAFRPEIVLHMAAQPLVRLSYRDPIGTYATNVMGTVHLLEAVRHTAGVKAAVSVTSDKAYENNEWPWGYRESDPMGGHDPYSSSKGCAELVTTAWRRSYFSGPDTLNLASGRAGNVIGGGDWAEDRLVPDILEAFSTGKPAMIRNPMATRPWQHVLEPLHGYLCVAERLYEDGGDWAGGWNFGPAPSDIRPVSWIVERMVSLWGDGARWELVGGEQPHEAFALSLDCSKARQRLGWEPAWPLDTALRRIVAWQKARLAGESVRKLCEREIGEYAANRQRAIQGAI